MSSPLWRLILLASAVLAAGVDPGLADWPHMQGPNHDGISRETGLAAAPIKELWRTRVGTGFCSVTVAEGRLYTMGNVKEFDIVFCLDAATGKQIWRRSYPCRLDPNSYEGGPNSTPTVFGGKLYMLSKEGHIYCMEATTGKEVWRKHATDVGAGPPTWGFAGSPLVLGDAVYFNVGDSGLALHKDTGKVLWKSTGKGAGYANVVAYQPLKGSPALAIFRGDGLIGVDRATGRVLWSFTWKNSAFVNAADPIYMDGKFFISCSYGTGSCMVDVSGAEPVELWRSTEMNSHFASCVLHDGKIYGMDGHAGNRGRLKCIDPATGKALWKREVGFGSMRMADGKLYVLNEDGELFVAAAEPKAYRELHKSRLLSHKCWTVPVISDGRLYMRTATGELGCWALK